MMSRVEQPCSCASLLATARSIKKPVFTLILLLGTALGLAGCGLAAAPCRVTAAGLKIIPVLGPVAAAPADGCADAIDPTPTGS